jgi:hypothetical protein
MKKIILQAVSIFFISILSCAVTPCVGKAIAERSYSTYDFIQSDWSEGASADTVSLSQFSSWNKYSSISGSLTTDTAINNPGGGGDLISSPIDLENREVHFITGNINPATNVYGRVASTVDGLNSALWVQYSSTTGDYLDGRYFQYMISLADPYYIADDIHLSISDATVGGYITDAVTGEPLQEYTVTGELCSTYVWPSGRGVPGPFYVSCDYAVGDTTKTITVTAPGYATQTKIIAISQNDWHTGVLGGSMVGFRTLEHLEGSTSYSGDISFAMSVYTAGSSQDMDPAQGVTVLPRTGASQVLSVVFVSTFFTIFLFCRRLALYYSKK